MNISRSEFERLIQEALDAIPKPFRRRLENLAVTLEDQPNAEQRQTLHLKSRDTLLGLYQGVPLTERGADFGNALPDKITLFRIPLEELCPDLQTLKHEIRKTVWHEVGHYFGLSDPELRRLERAAEAGLSRRAEP